VRGERRVFELQLERAYLRTAFAVVSSGAAEVSPEVAGQLADELRAVEQRLLEAEMGCQTTPMARLAERLALSPGARDFLWTAVAVDADPRMTVHLTTLTGTEARRGLTLSSYASIGRLDGEAARALALELGARHPLQRFRLLEPVEGARTRSARAFEVPDRVVSYLAGDDALDPGLAGLGAVVEVPDPLQLDPAQQHMIDRIVEALDGDAPLVILIQGRVDSGRRTAAARVSALRTREVVALDLKRVPPSAGALESALIALRREALLRGALPLVAEVDDVGDVHQDGGARRRLLAGILDTIPVPVFATTTRPGYELGTGRRVLRIDWPAPDHATRRLLWTDALGPDAAVLGDEVAQLAHRYRLGPGGVRRATETARLVARARGERGALSASDLVIGVRNDIAERIGDLATRVEVKQSWDDLVLSEDLVDQINGLIARVRHSHRVYEDWGFHSKAARGVGVPALFSGPPGTGKTMVAGIIARELGLELLQVDLSQVVSKWIGETEKQLSKVFDAAEAGHALLLFDEADALFAQRTSDVKGATDRYANLEVNYLLQRVESFGGIVILTTNLDTSIDKALKRRLAAHIVFFPPDEDEREDLWRRLLTTRSAPIDLDELDFASLARDYPDMTGANIRNAVLSAAFLAAAEDARIGQVHLERAARGEYRTMGRILR
jgi:AAA+ superfamily predicted ATPase